MANTFSHAFDRAVLGLSKIPLAGKTEKLELQLVYIILFCALFGFCLDNLPFGFLM